MRGVRTNAATLLTAAMLALTSVAAGAQQPGGSMVYLSSKIPSLNPLHAQYDVGLVSSQIFATLVRMDESNRSIPYLAESFSVSDDGLSYTFNLERNPDHFVAGLPYLDQVVYQMVTDKTAKRIGLQRNEFQLANASAAMRLTDIESFKKVEHLARRRPT